MLCPGCLKASKINCLKLPYFVDRRSRDNKIQTNKIINKVDNVDPNKFLSFSAMQHGYAARQSDFVPGNEVLPSLGLSRKQCKLELWTDSLQCVVES